MKDVAFTVEDCRGLYKKAIASGAKSVREPWVESDDHGTITFATVQTVYIHKRYFSVANSVLLYFYTERSDRNFGSFSCFWHKFYQTFLELNR